MTTNALDRVCAGIRNTLRRGDVAIDIQSAFNSVLWSTIRDGVASPII